MKTAPQWKISPEDVISIFEDQYDFLHPAYHTPVCLDNDPIPYPSYEHALIASKLTTNNTMKESTITSLCGQIKQLLNIRDAKKLVNQHITDNSQWKSNCIKIAEKLIRDKFFRSKVSIFFPYLSSHSSCFIVTCVHFIRSLFSTLSLFLSFLFCFYN